MLMCDADCVNFDWFQAYVDFQDASVKTSGKQAALTGSSPESPNTEELFGQIWRDAILKKVAHYLGNCWNP